jgi:parvulin-like peptidyl-prolyl isomerase
MKQCLYPSIVFLLLSFNLLAQDKKVENLKLRLLKINSIDQVKNMLMENEMIGDILTIDSKIDSSQFAKYWISRNIGEILITQPAKDTTYLFKLIKLDSIKLFRVQYIFLDKTKLSLKKIDSLRRLIFRRLDKGNKFDALAREYSMDGNSMKGGDLGWFEEGQMMEEFQNAISKHQLGETFKVDIESKGWYYIVKNSFLPKFNKKAIVFYLQSINND